MPAAAPPLDYAPPTTRRRWRRVLLLTAVLTIAGIAAYHHKAILKRGQLLLAQHRCLTFTAPPDKVVFESDPTRGAALAAADPAYASLGSLPWREPYGTVYAAPALGAFRTLAGVPNGPAPVSYYGTQVAGFGAPATLFMHSRRAVGAGERLVVVELDGRTVHVQIFRPGGIAKPPELRWSGYTGWDAQEMMKRYALFNDPRRLGIQFFAGQPDPADASRFTIAARFAGVDATLRGRLLPDDSVEITMDDADGVAARIIKTMSPFP